jgi:branched-chain amino acid aminotransferase/4-amino-4-deoxychorismate lyase
MIPQNDRGLLLGDGLFETLLAVDGDAPWIEAHLDRMAAGCVALGLPPLDRAAARAQCLMAAPATERSAVRLTLTAGSGGRGLERPATVFPRLIATSAPSPVVDTPAALVIAAVRRNEGSPAARLKTLAYLDNVLARAEARAAGADEAVMLNNRGQVSCAAAANLFWIEDGRLVTPALACGVLAGITRGRVLALAHDLGVEVLEVAAGRSRLEAADGMFLTNSLIGVRPVSRLGEQSLNPHALIARLKAGLDS